MLPPTPSLFTRPQCDQKPVALIGHQAIGFIENSRGVGAWRSDGPSGLPEGHDVYFVDVRRSPSRAC
eukprot:409292-Pyramimonas_sp.AAC.1